jgi:hypothetical protein
MCLYACGPAGEIANAVVALYGCLEQATEDACRLVENDEPNGEPATRTVKLLTVFSNHQEVKQGLSVLA